MRLNVQRQDPITLTLRVNGCPGSEPIESGQHDGKLIDWW